MKIIEMSIKSIKPYENNPRKNEEAIEKVAASIQQFGFKVPIVVDKNNVIISGHTRYLASELLGLTKVPVIVADDLDESQVKAYRIADNKVAEFSEWDYYSLAEELQGITDLDIMAEFGFDDSEIEGILSLNDVSSLYEEDIEEEGGYAEPTGEGGFKPNYEPKQSQAEVTEEEFVKKEEKAKDVTQKSFADNGRKIICPHCGEEFIVTT